MIGFVFLGMVIGAVGTLIAGGAGLYLIARWMVS